MGTSASHGMLACHSNLPKELMGHFNHFNNREFLAAGGLWDAWQPPTLHPNSNSPSSKPQSCVLGAEQPLLNKSTSSSNNLKVLFKHDILIRSQLPCKIKDLTLPFQLNGLYGVQAEKTARWIRKPL